MESTATPPSAPQTPPNTGIELAAITESASDRLNEAAGSATESNAAVKLAQNEFKDILEDVRATPHHVQVREQVIAYKRLMNHLDGIAEKNFKQCKYWRSAVALVVFSVLTAALVCSLTVEPVNHWRLLKQRLWQWVTMTIMVTSVFSVVPFLTLLFSWPAKQYWKTSKYAVYFICRMKRSVDVTIWACIVLTGWYLWFRWRLKHVYGDVSVVVVSQVTRFLIALCIGSLLWSIKNALHLKLKADLHYDQLFDRITQSIIYLNGVNVLDGRQPKPNLKIPVEPKGRIPVEFLAYNNHQEYKMTMMLMKLIRWLTKSKGNEESNYNCNNIWMDVKKMRREDVPIWILQRLAEEYLKEVKLLRPDNADLLLKDDEQLLEEANRMFEQIVLNQDCREIRRDDLSHPDYGLSEEELDEFFKKKRYETLGNTKNMKQEDGQLMSSNGQESQENTQSKPKPQGKENSIPPQQETETPTKKEMVEKPIDKDDFINWAVRAHKNCWSLELTLESSKTAFAKLNRMLSAFLLVLVVIIWLLLSKIVTTAQLALLFAPFLAASFMFENSSMKMFHGIIFTFAMHPFDVGDRVIIENTQMRVKELNIMTSVFVKYDTGAEVIFPNSKLVNTKIVNLDITPDQSDTLEFIIKADTPLEDIRDLELKIQKLLDDHLFYSSETKVVKSSYPENEEELKMTVHLKYLVSYLTADIKATRRSEIFSMIMKFRKEMEENKKDYLLQHHVIYHLELTIPKNVKLSGIDYLKDVLLSSLEAKGYKYCKAVMTDLITKDNKLKMALFVSESDKDTSRKKEDKPGGEGIQILQDQRVFNSIDNSLSECGYADLKVSQGEHGVYPDTNWKEAFKRRSLKELQMHPNNQHLTQLHFQRPASPLTIP